MPDGKNVRRPPVKRGHRDRLLTITRRLQRRLKATAYERGYDDGYRAGAFDQRYGTGTADSNRSAF